MTDRPIIYSAPMICALLDGRKTQTRRIVKPSNSTVLGHPVGKADARWTGLLFDHPDVRVHTESGDPGLSVPYVHPADVINGDPATTWESGWAIFAVRPRIEIGDRLWVREAWAHYQTVDHVKRPDGRAFDEVSDGLAGYKADGHATIGEFRHHVRLMSGWDLQDVVINGNCWRPSIHMPRWASRITQIVTDIRVERVQDISEEDAWAEGVCAFAESLDTGAGWGRLCTADRRSLVVVQFGSARNAFRCLWDSLYGAEPVKGWDANPWVWAHTFTVHRRNIDAMEATDD